MAKATLVTKPAVLTRAICKTETLRESLVAFVRVVSVCQGILRGGWLARPHLQRKGVASFDILRLKGSTVLIFSSVLRNCPMNNKAKETIIPKKIEKKKGLNIVTTLARKALF